MRQWVVYPRTAYIGVYKAEDGRFLSFFGQPGKRRLVGLYDDAVTAAIAYDRVVGRRYRADAITNAALGRMPSVRAGSVDVAGTSAE